MVPSIASVICLHAVKRSVLFQTIQFSISHLFTLSLNVKQFYLTQVIPLWDRVNLGVIAMKGYSTFPKAPALLEPHHQID